MKDGCLASRKDEKTRYQYPVLSAPRVFSDRHAGQQQELHDGQPSE
jgi:hypothetical protein